MRLGTGHPVLHFERIDSTNAEARRLAEQGEQGPLWIVADEQTAGRGRIGRNWVSEPGNLYATFLFAITAGPEVAAQVSFVAALAVHDMVTALLPSISPRIKWPNDVLIGGAKFCGVLPEVVGTAPTRIAIGCGVNIAQAPEGTPYPVTCLAAHDRHPGESPDPRQTWVPAFAGMTADRLAVESVLQHLDASLSNRLKIWDEGRGFAAIRRAWEARALGVGSEVAARAGTIEIRGTFKGLAADGALVILQPGGTEHTVHAGEVSFAELERLRNPTP